MGWKSKSRARSCGREAGHCFGVNFKGAKDCFDRVIIECQIAFLAWDIQSLTMPVLKDSPLFVAKTFEAFKIPTSTGRAVVCAAKGPRPRYPRVWKTNRRIGTISKAAKLVKNIKELSNVKEEVYGALDSFVAWELEFPLITVKKALKTLEEQQEWKRIIQVIKWMLSKGQGRTMGSYFTLINALAEDDRLNEAEELWTKLLMQNMEAMPRKFFDKMISIYYNKGLHEKVLEVFADMEELGVYPSISVVSTVGDVFQKLGMPDKYDKLNGKYPPPKWKFKYIRGKRVRIRVKHRDDSGQVTEDIEMHEDVAQRQISNANEDEGHEHASNVINEALEQDFIVIDEEPEQTSDDLYDEKNESAAGQVANERAEDKTEGHEHTSIAINELFERDCNVID
ncbi:hypothetical protein L6164_008399 [Bauhinia variegata]|uniref:Uncharacterized protein n=1 Tax=Bauhinia variegata TaxID=167791 RepID=A0ACB9PGJ6_BAUVA|nr:hypothetical protein L6164_008399 [Bauhinia variegata]